MLSYSLVSAVTSNNVFQKHIDQFQLNTTAEM